MTRARTRDNSKNEGKVKNPNEGTTDKKKSINIIPFLPVILIIVTYAAMHMAIGNRLLFTPDLDRSDAVHLNLSLKYYLAQSLKSDSFPLWTHLLQGGFPLFAESQIGALFLPNIVLLKILPFVPAYNLLFVTSLLLITLGTYLFLADQGVRRYIALLLGFTFAFSGAISFRWIHLNVLQALSMMPFLFYFARRYLNRGGAKNAIGLSATVSQLVYAGHMQIAFLAFFGWLLWLIAISRHEYTHVRKALPKLLPIFFFVACGIVLALPQVLATLVLARYSSRSLVGSYSYATLFSMPWKNILSFFAPFPFGNPKFGSYPEFPSDLGIFWENSPYLGILLPVFVALQVWAIAAKRKYSRLSVAFFAIAGFLVLLALGKNSPLYFLFDIFPFNMFRTPPKYLIMATFFLVAGIGLSLEQISAMNKRRFFPLLTGAVLLANVALLAYTAASYHVFLPAENVLSAPAFTGILKAGDRYISVGYDRVWHDYFARNGWATPKDIESYRFINNALLPDMNLMFGLDSYTVNSGGFRLRRTEYMADFIETSLSPAGNSPVSTSSASNALGITGIRYLITAFPVSAPYAVPVKEVRQGNLRLFLYRFKDADSSPVYVPTAVRKIDYVEDFDALMSDGKVSTAEAVAEGLQQPPQPTDFRILSVKRNGNDLTVQIELQRKGLVVFRENWFPGWSFEVDGKKTPLYRTNLIHMGTVVPAGRHTILLRLESGYLTVGFALSISAFLAGGLYLAARSIRNVKNH